jgi:hypothetical protein
MLDRLKKFLRNYKTYHLLRMSLYLKYLRLMAVFIPDDVYVKWQYKKTLGKELNLTSPVSFNEKLQWLKLNWKDKVLTTCADKYAVREYVKDRIGDHILIRLYGVYDGVEDIFLENLPESFVLKVTHGSGQNILCKNKKDVDWAYEFAFLKIYLANNHYYFGREFPYKNIVPRIICEELLDDGGKVPKDYKFYCFNGQPHFVEVHFDRYGQRKNNLYDMNWNLLPVEMTYPRYMGDVSKPESFEEMISYAKTLAKDMPFVRVDFYNFNYKVYFGEMTFYPACGMDKFSPENYDDIFGSMLTLPKK